MRFMSCISLVWIILTQILYISHNFDSIFKYHLQITSLYFCTGLTKSTRDLKNFRHVTAMADYALRIRDQLEYVNEHSFNNFKIRIGKYLMHFFPFISCILERE